MLDELIFSFNSLNGPFSHIKNNSLLVSIYSSILPNNSSHSLTFSSSPPIQFDISYILLSNLSILQNLSHIPPKILQHQNYSFLWPDLLLFYPTNMKRNERTGNWSHIFISQEWISSSFHQHLYNINLIFNWCLHERSPSMLKMKSNLTIDDKRWGWEIIQISDILNKERKMDVDMRGG